MPMLEVLLLLIAHFAGPDSMTKMEVQCLIKTASLVLSVFMVNFLANLLYRLALVVQPESIQSL